MIEIAAERRRTYLRNCRLFAVTSTVFAALYMWWLLFDARPDTEWLYWLLVAAETFNILQALGFWITISFQKWSEPEPPDRDAARTVDLLITVRGEPADVVEHTLAAAAAVRHPAKRVWVLDDGDSPEIRVLAGRFSAKYVARHDHSGAKAGNLNNALSLAHGEHFAVFDADQAPHPEFLEATLGAFSDPHVAFVQTPQVYRNRAINRVAAGAHDQQGLFYGPILRGKNGMRAVFCCGTNVVFSRSAIDEIGGIPEDSITEDLRATLLLLRRGYSSVYVSRVLAEGLGPLDVTSYFNQQFRWGRGGLDILFRRRPYSRSMSFAQGLQFSLGFLYWFTGWAYFIYLLMPVFFLTLRLRPIQVPNQYPAHFLPYILSALATIVYATDFKVTLRRAVVHARVVPGADEGARDDTRRREGAFRGHPQARNEGLASTGVAADPDDGGADRLSRLRSEDVRRPALGRQQHRVDRRARRDFERLRVADVLPETTGRR